MDSKEKTIISVQATINAPIEKVWKNWTNPETITRWNNASDEWFTPRAENDLRVGGKFLSRMESKVANQDLILKQKQQIHLNCNVEAGKQF